MADQEPQQPAERQFAIPNVRNEIEKENANHAAEAAPFHDKIKNNNRRLVAELKKFARKKNADATQEQPPITNTCVFPNIALNVPDNDGDEDDMDVYPMDRNTSVHWLSRTRDKTLRDFYTVLARARREGEPFYLDERCEDRKLSIMFFDLDFVFPASANIMHSDFDDVFVKIQEAILDVYGDNTEEWRRELVVCMNTPRFKVDNAGNAQRTVGAHLYWPHLFGDEEARHIVRRAIIATLVASPFKDYIDGHRQRLQLASNWRDIVDKACVVGHLRMIGADKVAPCKCATTEGCMHPRSNQGKKGQMHLVGKRYEVYKVLDANGLVHAERAADYALRSFADLLYLCSLRRRPVDGQATPSHRLLSDFEDPDGDSAPKKHDADDEDGGVFAPVSVVNVPPADMPKIASLVCLIRETLCSMWDEHGNGLTPDMTTLAHNKKTCMYRVFTQSKFCPNNGMAHTSARQFLLVAAGGCSLFCTSQKSDVRNLGCMCSEMRYRDLVSSFVHRVNVFGASACEMASKPKKSRRAGVIDVRVEKDIRDEPDEVVRLFRSYDAALRHRNYKPAAIEKRLTQPDGFDAAAGHAILRANLH